MRKTVKFSALLIVMTMLFAMAGCYFVSPKEDKFKAAIKEVMGVTDDQIRTAAYAADKSPISGCTKVITYSGSGVQCIYYQFASDKQAKTYFEKYYGNFEDIFEDSGYSGEYQKSSSGSRGYIYMDGNFKSGSQYFGVGKTYGGAYYQGSVVIVVLEHSGGNSKSLARNFLDELNYPTL